MLAYESVANSVGMTAEWLRKFIKSNEAKEPRITVGLNLLLLYRRVCDRVEQAGDKEKKLKGEIDAALESVGLLVEPTKRTDSVAAAAACLDGGLP